MTDGFEIYIFDENGFPLESRVEKVKSELETMLDGMKQKYLDEYCKLLEAGAKKVQLKEISAYTIKCELYRVLSKFQQIDNNVAFKATPQQINTIFCDFLSLVSWLNEYGSFIPSKQIFSAFSGISPTAYSFLMEDGTEEQREAISAVENFLVDMNMEAAQQGIAREATTKFRMQAKGSAGHSVTTATPVDDIIDKGKEVMSQADYNRLLGSIITAELQAPKK
jgi:hypothetical protein